VKFRNNLIIRILSHYEQMSERHFMPQRRRYTTAVT
jgi:hypothetical protein